MKLLKNNYAFTLIEMMIGGAIAAGLALIVINTMNMSNKATKDLSKGTELNFLIQSITNEFSKKQTCEINFKGLSMNNATLNNLKRRNGASIITKGQPFGNNITSVTNIATTGVAGTINTRIGKMVLTISYQPKPAPGVAPVTQQFQIPINVFLNNSSLIDTCFSDVQSLMEIAVKNACKGNGSQYFAYVATAPQYPYGHCEHQVQVISSTSTNMPSMMCPAGEVLQNIDTATTPGKMIFKCAKVTTGNCPAWSYMQGITATGAPNCVDIRTLFGGQAGIMVIRGGVYQAIAITCPANQVLQYVRSDGTPQCFDPNLNRDCPVGQYATGIGATGTPNCAIVPNVITPACGGAAASANAYMRSIAADGTWTCAGTSIPTDPASCVGTAVVNNIASNGYAYCTPFRPVYP